MKTKPESADVTRMVAPLRNEEQLCEFATWSRHSLGRPTVRLYRHYSSYMDQKLAPYGISAAHVPLLGYLWEGGGGDTQNEIAKTLGVDKATVSRTVAYLVRAGLVTQSVSSRDSRAFTVELTDAGRHLCGPVGSVLRTWTDALSAGMPAGELDSLLRQLDAMLERAGELLAELGINADEGLG